MEWGAVVSLHHVSTFRLAVLLLGLTTATTNINNSNKNCAQASSYLNQFAVFVPAGTGCTPNFQNILK